LAEAEALLRAIETEVIKSPTVRLSAADHDRLAQKGLEANFSLWDRNIKDVDGLLQTQRRLRPEELPRRGQPKQWRHSAQASTNRELTSSWSAEKLALQRRCSGTVRPYPSRCNAPAFDATAPIGRGCVQVQG
jgi:hypothetical protein